MLKNADIYVMTASEPLQVMLPENLDDLSPYEILDPHTGVVVAVLEKSGVPDLKLTWDTAKTFYVLLTPIVDTKWTVQVGYNSKGYLKDKLNSYRNWSSALIFRTVETDTQFTQEELTFLKNLLLEVFSSSRTITVTSTYDDAADFDSIDTEYMRHVLHTALKVLTIRGYRTSQIGAISRSISELYRPAPLKPGDSLILSKLHEWRSNKARIAGENIMLYGTNRELEDIAICLPRTILQLANIPNLSQQLTDVYGHELLEIVETYG